MKKVIIGMSGGVDSSVAAYLLKKEGYKVYGVSLKMLDDKKTENSIKDAQKVSHIIGIEHKVIDVKKEFEDDVINYFVNSYLNGLTPNPCPRCNRLIKFNFLSKEAEKIGANVATGHYIKLIKENDRIKITTSKNKNSQEYFISLIDKKIIENLVFPLGDYSKEEVIKIANQIGLDFIAKKESSQDICFIDVDHLHFIKRYSNPKDIEGYIKHEDGSILGIHTGYFKYTIGQRKGLGIGYKYPLYVTQIIPSKNEVIVGPKDSLVKEKIRVSLINSFSEIKESQEYNVKIRYKTLPVKAKITNIKDNIVTLQGNFTAPAPGQLAVFYEDECIIAAGDIIP